MQKFSILPLAVLAGSQLMAQNVYSPPGIGSVEDGLYTYYYGNYADARHMMVDGHHPSPAVYKSLALRLDDRSYASSTAQGRTWANLTLKLSPGDFDTFTQTFANNITTTPTSVFSGSVTWAAQTGYPPSTPAPWGSNGLVFPFGTGGTSGVYVHSKGDIVIDTEFTGGTLANSSAWSGSTTSSYYVDGPASSTSSVSGTGRYIPVTRLNRTATAPCNDSGMSTTTGSYSYASTTAYAGEYSIINYRNMLSWYTYSYYCGFENPVIHGIGLSSVEPGVDLGTKCNMLHVGTLVATYGMVTLPEAASTSGYTGYYLLLFPHKAAYVGLTATVQGAFTDTQDRSFKLTQAYEVTIPAVQPKTSARRKAIYHYTRASATGSSAPTSSYIYNPSLCWAQ